MGSSWPPEWGETGADFLATDDDVELVGATVRRALVAPAAPSVAAAHVRRMVAAHAEGPARGDRPFRPRAPRDLRARLVPLAGAVAAAGIAAAAVAGALPAPVQRDLAAAAAHVGVGLPGRDDRGTTRLSTPTPAPRPPLTASTTEPTATSVSPETAVQSPTTVTTAATGSTVAAPPARTPSTLPATIPPPAPAPPAPATTTRPDATTTLPSPTTSTTRAASGCANPGIVSATATLQSDGRTVSVVIRTSGTVPYMSATIDGVTGAVANLQPTSFGFQGTVTAPSAIPAGSLLVFGACGLRGSAPVLA
jgi:hypothetical protein